MNIDNISSNEKTSMDKNAKLALLRLTLSQNSGIENLSRTLIGYDHDFYVLNKQLKYSTQEIENRKTELFQLIDELNHPAESLLKKGIENFVLGFCENHENLDLRNIKESEVKK